MTRRISTPFHRDGSGDPQLKYFLITVSSDEWRSSSVVLSGSVVSGVGSPHLCVLHLPET
ncbi:MAG: hypothetical protein AAFR31_19475 [Cyanobacteria bacterium J06627_8]